MRVLAYPADRHGCGHHRIIWPAEALAARGRDVTIVMPGQRHVVMGIDDRRDEVAKVDLPADVDVIVLQRVTHRYLAQAVAVMRRQGVAVVVDVDDDLSAIHPGNAAFDGLHPSREGRYVGGQRVQHSWHNLARACADATLVTATTPALLRRYAVHGRGVVLPNYLSDHYYNVEHTDSDRLGWPASLHSHPDDPAALGNAVSRLVDEGARLMVTSCGRGVGQAFGRAGDDEVDYAPGPIPLLEWPRVIAEIGVAVVPLADTRFNTSKSWLKAIELSATGVPWVASPRAEYQRLHEMGAGLLADRPRQWYAILRKLRGDPELRAELSEAGRAVAEKLRLRDHVERWWDAWQHARELQS